MTRLTPTRLLLGGLCLLLSATSWADFTASPAEARDIAKEAYLYGFPVVEMYKTLYAQAVDKGGPNFKAPLNHIGNTARVFTPKDTAVITPNSDTPYSFVWLDLRAEPVVITVPKMEAERYFVFQLMDLYTYNFAYIGSRETGNGGGNFLLAGPGWQGIAIAQRPEDEALLSAARALGRQAPK